MLRKRRRVCRVARQCKGSTCPYRRSECTHECDYRTRYIQERTVRAGLNTNAQKTSTQQIVTVAPMLSLFVASRQQRLRTSQRENGTQIESCGDKQKTAHVMIASSGVLLVSWWCVRASFSKPAAKHRKLNRISLKFQRLTNASIDERPRLDFSF